MNYISKLLRLMKVTKKTKISSVKMSEESVANEDEIRKQKLVVEGGQDGVKDQGQSNLESPIFKLNIDCFDEIFDYLTMRDLHSFGQTCKAMQQVAGEYFKRNYKSCEKFSGDDGIYSVYSDNNGVICQRTQTSGFNQFINCISHYYEKSAPLHYIRGHSHEFSSINHIYLVCLRLNLRKVKYLRSILPKIEVVQIRQCTVDGDFYNVFLKHCKKLKKIYIQDDLGDILDENGSLWLRQAYPLLEHLELTPRYSFKINELCAFFEQHPNVQTFSTSSRCLWENRHELMKSDVSLDKLEIQILDNYYRHLMNMQTICALLNQLYERGFYKRLHLYVKRNDHHCCCQVTTLLALEKLSVRQFDGTHSLSNLTNLKELDVNVGLQKTDIEILAINLLNLEFLSLGNVVADDILPFLNRSEKLYRIHAHFKENVIDLRRLNKEREKLARARKVTIYVPDNIFLATKWSTVNGDTKLNLIEMRKASQY